MTETQEQYQHRLAAIDLLQKVASEWAISIALSKGATEADIKGLCHIKISVFGSFFLDVHFPETDIDAICVFRQQYVSRSDFFDSFVKKLETSEGFSNIHLIQQARVPIIKVMVN